MLTLRPILMAPDDGTGAPAGAGDSTPPAGPAAEPPAGTPPAEPAAAPTAAPPAAQATPPGAPVAEPAPPEPPAEPPVDVEAIATQQAAQAAQLAEQKQQIEEQREQALDLHLDRLGVLEKYRAMAPKVNPFTADGKKQLQDWAADRPEICSSRLPKAPDFDPSAEVAKMKSPHLVDQQTWRERMRSVGR